MVLRVLISLKAIQQKAIDNERNKGRYRTKLVPPTKIGIISFQKLTHQMPSIEETNIVSLHRTIILSMQRYKPQSCSPKLKLYPTLQLRHIGNSPRFQICTYMDSYTYIHPYTSCQFATRIAVINWFRNNMLAKRRFVNIRLNNFDIVPRLLVRALNG